jgi:adenylate kinase
LDWHTCELFPERWVDLVVILRCNHTTLWDRLEKRSAQLSYTDNARVDTMNRGYPLKKIQENNEAEIMEVVAEEARSSYAQEIVVELTSEGTEDLESNVARIVQWITTWRQNQQLSEADS